MGQPDHVRIHAEGEFVLVAQVYPQYIQNVCQFHRGLGEDIVRLGNGRGGHVLNGLRRSCGFRRVRGLRRIRGLRHSRWFGCGRGFRGVCWFRRVRGLRRIRRLRCGRRFRRSCLLRNAILRDGIGIDGRGLAFIRHRLRLRRRFRLVRLVNGIRGGYGVRRLLAFSKCR